MAVMFDSKEIAKRALLRAEEIKAEKKRRRVRIGSAGVLFSLCAAAAVFALTQYQAYTPAPHMLVDEPRIPLAEAMQPDAEARPYPAAAAERAPDIVIPAYDRAAVPAGETGLQMTLLNPEANPCYFTFEIILEDTGESLYQSGLTGPAMCIDGPVLKKGLTQGEYKAALIIRAYELDSLAAISSVTVKFDLSAL